MNTSTSNVVHNTPIETNLALGNRAMHAGDYEKAIDYYLKALEERPVFSNSIRFNLDYAKSKLNKKINIKFAPSQSGKVNFIDGDESQYRSENSIEFNSHPTKKITLNSPEILSEFSIYLNKLMAIDEEINLNFDGLVNDCSKLIDIISAILELGAISLDELFYNIIYTDVAEAITDKHFNSGQQHYELYGKKDGRIWHALDHVKHYRDNLFRLNHLITSQKKEIDSIKTSCLNAQQHMAVEHSNPFLIIPYYIPKTDSHSIQKECKSDMDVAIHLHLFHIEMLEIFAEKLNNMPITYDLYVSVSEHVNCNDISQKLYLILDKVNIIFVENVPNRGRDIAPFIIQFGRRLSKYEFICHIHTKKSEHNTRLNNWCESLLDHLLGSPWQINHIFYLLETTAKIVFPEGQSQYIPDPTGWADNYDIAKEFLTNYTDKTIDNFQSIEFPEGFMFWARTNCLKEYLKLPIKWSDFPEEPIPPDGTLAHALERLFFIFAFQADGQYIRLHKKDSESDYRFYEEEIDYSPLIVHNDIKVLSFYLPQFHPIPENDEWHGKGFTEWSKVREANPLFQGHYQQHIPHPDIGYYLLESIDTLIKQAELMFKSGVFGQIFYHYWFSGKLILEEPAQLLLKNPQINMPFCFCWANENWTRAWDGNEKDVLLKQDYSYDDAINFITYLIPFFKDERYIKIDNRPVLYVYRPSAIINPDEYLKAWNYICVKEGLPEPYIIAVLTRGATDPRDFGMDAAVERVLHDWTAGSVPEIKNTLRAYHQINGSVLNYNEVADFYGNQNEQKPFTYFRSLIPIWDNTARYGTEAYIIHQSTPGKFQEWMEKTIDYTKSTLTPEKRFIIINAWNEWAEGAHLEPDTRHGYAYLNSVGRSLANIKYDSLLNPTIKLAKELKLNIVIPDFLLETLKADSQLRLKFIHHLSSSSIFKLCNVRVNNQYIVDECCNNFFKFGVHSEADYVLQFRRPALIQNNCIENMLQTAVKFPGTVVLSNQYDTSEDIINIGDNGAVEPIHAYNNPLLLLPNNEIRNYKARTDALTFLTNKASLDISILPEVTTIIRFHKSSNFSELRNALYCLTAMHSCIVIPLIAAQDLNEEQISRLKKLLTEFTYEKNYEPKLFFYYTENNTGDLRSKMLNEAIKQVETRFVTFLDYDDRLFPNAFAFLIERIIYTGKAVSFGRVYSTEYNSEKGIIMGRQRIYEYGYSYKDFLQVNHAPLHSFMIDLSRIDLSMVEFFDNQTYMEDYYFTLQIFNQDNVDWEVLGQNYYIGDYMHCVDREHTLAILCEERRSKVLADPHYIECEARIHQMRQQKIALLSDYL